jgi:hypothetical protein
MCVVVDVTVFLMVVTDGTVSQDVVATVVVGWSEMVEVNSRAEVIETV